MDRIIFPSITLRTKLIFNPCHLQCYHWNDRCQLPKEQKTRSEDPAGRECGMDTRCSGHSPSAAMMSIWKTTLWMK
jgi:hypothetical protein